MAEILSQEEIDSLLNSLSSNDVFADSGNGSDSSIDSSGEELEELPKNITLYDFRRPDRVSKEQLRFLQNIHENYIRELSTTLTSILRTLVEIELLSVDQLTYQEFIMSVPNPSALFIFNAKPFEGEAIFEINLELVFMIIDKLFGGPGNSSIPNRELTSLELGIIRKIVVDALKAYKEAWNSIIDINPQILSYESNPQFIQIIPGSEIVILITFEVRLQNEMSGMMSICLPYLLLEPVLLDLGSESWTQKKEEVPQFKEKIVEQILDTKLKVSCELGKIRIKLGDFLQLKNQDIIILNKKIDNIGILKVSNKDKFLGKIGVSNNKKAIKILRELDIS